VSREEKPAKATLLTSNCHAYFAAIFDLFGRVELVLDVKGTLKYQLVAAAPEPYVSQLRRLYGGRVTRNGWKVEGEEAEAFAKAVKYFTTRQQREFPLLLSASQTDAARQPLSEEQRRKRVKAVESLGNRTPEDEPIACNRRRNGDMSRS